MLTVLSVMLVGGAAGCLGALLGLGGGIFLVPYLNLVVGLPIRAAVAISLVTVIATSSVTSANAAQRHLINLRLGMMLEAFTAPAALAGALWAQAVPESALRTTFAITAAVIAVVMLSRLNRRNVILEDDIDVGLFGGRFHDTETSAIVAYRPKRLPVAAVTSAAAGLLSGLVGIGGGIVKVPVLNSWCGVPIRVAAATSAFMIGVTGVSGAIIYYAYGHLLPDYAAASVVGVLLGGKLGLWLGPRAKVRWLKLLMAGVLVLVALSYLLAGGGA